MNSLVVANFFGIIVLLIVILGIISNFNKTRSSKALLYVCYVCMVCNLADALCYLLYGSFVPDTILFFIFMISFNFGTLLLIFYTNYWYSYILERIPINRLFVIVPMVIQTCAFVYSLVLFLAGKVINIENGVMILTGGMPKLVYIVQILSLVYLPLVVVFHHKKIGIKSVFFLGFFGIVPLLSLVLSILLNIPDYSYPASSLSILLVYVLLDTNLSREKEKKYQQELLESNRKLVKKNAEMEETLDDIRLLNRELEDAKHSAESANRAKTTFLNNMSHDIRTPMNAIIGFTGLMETSLDNKEKLKDYLEKIKTSGNHLLYIINNVLEIARIDSGRVVLDEDVFDLTSNENNVVPMVAVQMKEKNLKLDVNFKVEHRYVYVDIGKSKQIVINLLSNAVKYTPEGGTITANFTEVPCDKKGYATYVTEVSDTGIGMSKEFMEHIFESFSRENNTTESKVLGSGLGMHIVKQLVDLMGGKIEVESEVGKGTTFRVYNTHKIAEEPQLQVDKSKSKIIEKGEVKEKTILLAEDNDLNAEIATTILTEFGHKVERACDGIEVIGMLNKAESDYYDVILMDVQMPNMNGMDATKKIRKFGDEQKAKIPIIAMTANAFEEDKRKFLEIGMDGFVPKPINVQELLNAIASIARE